MWLLFLQSGEGTPRGEGFADPQGLCLEGGGIDCRGDVAKFHSPLLSTMISIREEGGKEGGRESGRAAKRRSNDG